MLIVTIVAVVIAVLNGAIAWRLLHREQRRSAARVTALEAEIDHDPPHFDRFQPEPPLDPFPRETPLDPSSHTFVFVAPRPTFRSRGPLLTAAISLVAGVVVIVLMAMLADRDRAPAVDAVAPASIELLSMTHLREGSAIVVTGLVRNPSPGETAPLTTTVTALDRNGQIIGSATSNLAALAPGTTLPFNVRIDNVGSLARYRVSFRANGAVVPHVDRRASRAAPGVSTE
jgi:hypothetical protein